MKSQMGRMRSQHKEELNSYPAGVEAGRQSVNKRQPCLACFGRVGGRVAGSPLLTWHPQEEVRSIPAQGLSPTVLSMLVALGLLQRCRAHLSTSVNPAARHHGPSLEWGIYQGPGGLNPTCNS